MRILKSAGAVCLALSMSLCAIGRAQELVKVFKPGHDVTSPQLLPTDFSQAIATDCPVKLSGAADLSLIVAADGTPKNILFLHFTGTELDRLAVRLLSQQRFTPGTHDGAPIAVSQSVKMKLDGCLAIAQDANGQNHVVVQLSRAPEEHFSDYSGYPGEVIFTRPAPPDEGLHRWPVPAGVYRVGKGITPPIATNAPEAKFPPESQAKRINAICLVALVVDANGLPQNLRTVRPVSPPYDEQAINAVSRYRFKPAIKDGKEPVPVMITVEINFRPY
ncbi:MAG: energy transducer TonB [Acidobacteriota bacterium]